MLGWELSWQGLRGRRAILHSETREARRVAIKQGPQDVSANAEQAEEALEAEGLRSRCSWRVISTGNVRRRMGTNGARTGLEAEQVE